VDINTFEIEQLFKISEFSNTLCSYDNANIENAIKQLFNHHVSVTSREEYIMDAPGEDKGVNIFFLRNVTENEYKIYKA